MKKILVTTPFQLIQEQKDEFLSLLLAGGFEVEWLQAPLSEEQLIEKWPGVTAHIGGSDHITARALQAADSLRIISKIGVGYETIDVKSATKKGIAVANTPGVNSDAVAEYTLALMLAMSRRVVSGDRLIRSGGYSRLQGYTLYNKTLGIIGLGSIGRLVANLASCFHMRVLAYTRSQDRKYTEQHGIQLCTLDELLTGSDFITIHVPLTESTCNMIGECELCRMKPSAQIINTSRQGIINEMALYHALKEGVISGAAIDVLAGEPDIPKDNPLLTLDNIILTPHIAASTYESLYKTVMASFQNVFDFFDGKRPFGILNPEVLTYIEQ